MALSVGHADARPLKVTGLLTEYLKEPLGIDKPNPGFTWRIETNRRNVLQTAYEVQVATSRELLESGKPDMWDSGKVVSDQCVQVRYAGKSLNSRTAYYWRVRVWDEKDRPSEFSEPAAFETALFDKSEWQGSWIMIPETAGGNGYHSEFADSVDTTKWVQVDLGEPKRFTTVVLYPARPYNYEHDIPGFGFPVRYRIEASGEPDFRNPRIIADRTDSDQGVLPVIPVTIPVGDVTARYVRIVATKLHHPKGTRPLFALAELEVLDERSNNLAIGARVTAMDSIESSGWSKEKLTDGGRVSREPGGASPILRKEFTLDKPIARARAYVTGLGYYEFRLNGKKVGDRVLDPAYTNFDKRVYYSTYDVTRMLKQGRNCAAAMLGQGWWRKPLQFRLMVCIEFKDGTNTVVTTNGEWKYAQGPIIENSIYNGEIYDARLERPGWDQPGFDDSSWKQVKVVDTPKAVLSAQMIQPIKVVENIKPQSMHEPKPGVWVFDFGQNFSGWCKLQVNGPAGTAVKMRFAELVYPDGTVNQENLRSAKATDTYILKGHGTEIYEPRFTYHGFRYVQIEGFPGKPETDSVVGRVVHTAIEPQGSFKCSNDLLNKIQEACAWGERTNFHAVPTDCPQRDERQGWMGDAQVSSYAMLYNFDMFAAYSKFLTDIQDAQGEDGRVPDTVPHVWGSDPGDPMWAAAYPVILWNTYRHTGDKSLLQQHYEGVKQYVEMLRREAGSSMIIERNNYADWIAVTGTPKELISTGAFCLVTGILADIADALGKTEDALEYRKLKDKIGEAFNARFWDAERNRYGNGSQLSCALPLWLGIVPKERHKVVFDTLVEDIRSRGDHLSTGFVGTPYLMDVLVREGRADLAYTIATQTDYPSWGYMIANGATTIWELWELKTGSGMNSHNHPALGFVSGWFYEVLAGIAPESKQPGWKKVIIKPYALGDLQWAKGTIRTIKGVAESDWKLTRNGIRLSATIPAGSTGTVYVPKVGWNVFEIKESGKLVFRDGKSVGNVDGIHSGEDVGEWVKFEIGSGKYVFELAGETARVDVTRFGAVPNDGKDDTAAILAAIEECRKLAPAILLFPKGQYDFFAGSNPNDKGTLFPVADIDRLTIEGNGAEFIIHGVTGIFRFANCQNLNIRHFTIDWDRPPFSLGKVIAVEGNHFDVEVFPEYPVKGGEPVGAFMDFDPETRLPMRHGLDEYYTCEKTELVREQVLRVHLKHQARIKPGVLVQLRHQVYGPSTFVCSRCSNVTVEDVTVHTVPGMGFIGSVCTNINLKRFRVVPRPGSGHLMSATADATHFGGCKGTISMEDCEYEGMGDDAVNIKSGLYLSLKEKIDDRTILAAHNLKMIDAPDPGDVMEISHVDDLIPYATARVKKVEVLPNDGLHKVEFIDPLPAELKEGDVFGNATRTPKVRISNCRVRNNRARGMLIQTRDAIVENCNFTNCTGPGILVLTEVVYFFESIGTRDVVVRNCTFDHVNYGAAIGPGALCAMAYLKDFKYPPKPGVHKNVIFEGNVIRNTDNSGIFVAGTDGITIRSNKITNACDYPTTDSGSSAIYVMSSRDILIEANTADSRNQGDGAKTMLLFGDGIDKNTITIKNNSGF